MQSLKTAHASSARGSRPDSRRRLSLWPADAASSSLRPVKCRIAYDERQWQTEPAEARPVRTPWYEKPCPGWTDVRNIGELLRATNGSTGYKVVEFFIGSCHACKSSFPSVCKMAQEEGLQGHYQFFKANVQDDSLLWWMERQDITGLPYMAVFSPSGEMVLGTPCSMKRLPQVKAGLHAILEHPDSKQFKFNRDGALEPVP